MWSASSSTVIATSSSETMRCFIRSSRRPGQATTMSTPARIARSWPACFTPPKTVVTRSPIASAIGARTAAIWVASSRVGARTRPVG